MRHAQTKNPVSGRLRISIVLLIIAVALLSPLAYASKPYFKSFGSDVMTGGWFNDGSSVCTTVDEYQDPIFGDGERGGIITYSKINSTSPPQARQPAGGSSSQFAAFSVGKIDGNFGDSQQKGFYSSGATSSSTTADRLTFANNQDDLGGYFENGPPRQASCIPDYFNVKRLTQTPSPLPNLSCPATTAGDFYYVAPDNTPIVLNGGAQVDVDPGCKRGVFIQGNVFIQSNVVYGGAPTATSVPKFALVVLGNIYVGPNVSQLDGMYVAQPLPKCGPPSNPSPCTANPVTDDTGAIWTCHENSINAPQSAFLIPSCDSKLTVNGALIAKQVHFMRTNGDVLGATAGESLGGEDNIITASSSNNIAELINYSPAMVLGGPFFTTPANPDLKIQSLVSLPPIF